MVLTLSWEYKLYILMMIISSKVVLVCYVCVHMYTSHRTYLSKV